MSADGEIEIAVRAEGVDDAAEEIGDAEGGPSVAGGGDDGGGGLRQTIRRGGLTAALAALIGPLLNVLSPILSVLEAFLAPVAALLLRAFAPVLRALLQLLPDWFAFVSDAPGLLGDIVQFIRSLPRRIRDFLSDPLGAVGGALQTAIDALAGTLGIDSLLGLMRDVLGRLGGVLAELSTVVANGIAQGLRQFFGIGGGGRQEPPRQTGLGRNERFRREQSQRGTDVSPNLGIGRGAPPVNLTFQGGLEALIERIERESGIEL